MERTLIRQGFLFLLTIQLAGCAVIPYPREPEYDRVTGVEDKLKDYIARSADVDEVVTDFGEAWTYRQGTMRYKLCKGSEVGVLWFIAGGGYGGGIVGDAGPLPESCYELTLYFSAEEYLSRYQFEDWSAGKLSEVDYAEHRAGARQGDAEAQWKLYVSTGTIAWNVRWLCAAADQGHAEAQRRVAFLYRHGWYGLDPDPVKAHIWYSLSAKNGSHLAEQDAEEVWASLTIQQREEVELGLTTWTPGLCERELPRTDTPGVVGGFTYEEWLEKANEPNPDPEAQHMVWWLTEETGFEKYKWLCRAADQGLLKSQRRFGISYENGTSELKRNLVHSYMWYTFAGHSDPSSEEQASELRERLSKDELAEAQRLISAWEPGLCEAEIRYWLKTPRSGFFDRLLEN